MDIEVSTKGTTEFEKILETNRKVRMERTFWPVGHGAFYTERFPLEKGDYFTVAYDCGTCDEQELLHTQISNCLKISDHIDLLFISHFHKDHISGVEHLLKKGAIKRVCLPIVR